MPSYVTIHALIIQCRNSINMVFLVLYLIYIYIHHTIPCRYEYVEIVSNLCLEDATLSSNNIIPWRSLSCIPRGIFRSTYIFNGYSSVLTLPRYFGVLENLQFNDNPQHLDILYTLWITCSSIEWPCIKFFIGIPACLELR